MHLLGILWARRLIIIAAVLGALAGGGFVVATAPPRYLATAKVALNYIKPDPVTGVYINSKNADAYVTSQAQMISDVQTLGPAAAALGWMDSPDLAMEYASQPGADPQRFPIWVASRMVALLSVKRIEDSNLLEIGYRAPDPALAEQAVEAIRQAYVATSVAQRRQMAAESADRLDVRAESLKTRLAAAEGKKAAFERASGITYPGGRRDLENERLRYLVVEAPRPVSPNSATPQTIVAKLAKAEVKYAEAAGTLGPNHPQVARLASERDALRAEVELYRNNDAVRAASPLALMQAKAEMLEAQKAKVLSQREQMVHLRMYQDEIDLLRQELNTVLEGVVDLRQLSTSTESGLTPMGPPEAELGAVFPNPALILGGGGALGFLFGSLLALLLELLDRRVRCLRDLELSTGLPPLGAMPQVRPAKSRRAIKLTARAPLAEPEVSAAA